MLFSEFAGKLSKKDFLRLIKELDENIIDITSLIYLIIREINSDKELKELFLIILEKLQYMGVLDFSLYENLGYLSLRVKKEIISSLKPPKNFSISGANLYLETI